MKVRSLYVFCQSNDKIRTTAEIEVPGLGVVKVADVLCAETLERIQKEAIVALEVRMGHIIKPEDQT